MSEQVNIAVAVFGFILTGGEQPVMCAAQGT